MSKPYVLVTNDDGIDSPGLIALSEAIGPWSNLLIAAPVNQQTNMGRGARSDADTGIIEKRILNVNGAEHKAYAVHGSPAQTVAHAVLELAERKPDFCVSGINYGENLGLAFTCSGTLGACFEADSFGIPSVAFSRAVPMESQRSDRFGKLEWQAEKQHAKEIFRNVIKGGLPTGVHMLNVNFPENINESTEVRVTKQAYMNYGKYVIPKNRDMRKPYVLGWEINDRLSEALRDSDIYAVFFDGVISVTPIKSVMSVDSESYFGSQIIRD